MSSMNGLNTLKSIVILSIIILLMVFLVPSKDQIADIFTKSHPKGRLRALVDNLK